jgi:hypothetical protein
MILNSYRGRVNGSDSPNATVLAVPGDGTSLEFYREDGSDDVFATVLGPRAGVLGTVRLNPETISALVQELVGRGMHLTVAMQEALRSDREKSSG